MFLLELWISFDPVDYQAEETGGTVILLVALTGSADFPLSLTISTTDETASGPFAVIMI